MASGVAVEISSWLLAAAHTPSAARSFAISASSISEAVASLNRSSVELLPVVWVMSTLLGLSEMCGSGFGAGEEFVSGQSEDLLGDRVALDFGRSGTDRGRTGGKETPHPPTALHRMWILRRQHRRRTDQVHRQFMKSLLEFGEHQSPHRGHRPRVRPGQYRAQRPGVVQDDQSDVDLDGRQPLTHIWVGRSTQICCKSV